MSDDEEKSCYVGIKSCGCVTAACVDDPQWTKDTAKTISKWVREGLKVERRTVVWVRKNLFTCPHGKQESLI